MEVVNSNSMRVVGGRDPCRQASAVELAVGPTISAWSVGQWQGIEDEAPTLIKEKWCERTGSCSAQKQPKVPLRIPEDPDAASKSARRRRRTLASNNGPFRRRVPSRALEESLSCSWPRDPLSCAFSSSVAQAAPHCQTRRGPTKPTSKLDSALDVGTVEAAGMWGASLTEVFLLWNSRQLA